jgi:excisionase family DNA binding protein
MNQPNPLQPHTVSSSRSNKVVSISDRRDYRPDLISDLVEALADAIAQKVHERMAKAVPAAPVAKLLYTTKEAAKLLSRSQSWVEQQIRAQLLPARRNGRRLLIYHTDLEAFARRDVY